MKDFGRTTLSRAEEQIGQSMCVLVERFGKNKNVCEDKEEGSIIARAIQNFIPRSYCLLTSQNMNLFPKGLENGKTSGLADIEGAPNI